MSRTPTTVNNILIDPWSFMSFKGRFSESLNAAAWAAPNWVFDRQDRRRLQAYMLLASYTRNMARQWMNDTASQEDKDSRREYGDPGLLVEQIVASVVGQTFGIHVPGAEEPVQDRKENQQGEPEQSAEYAVLKALEEWSDKESFKQKILENENQQVELGDSVIVLGWDARRNRVRMHVWDPGFYFPVWSDDGSDDEGFDEEFPSRVHLAYEFEREVDGRPRNFVRRITYELAPPANNPEGPATCWMSDGVWSLGRGSRTNDIFEFDEAKADWRVRNLNLNIDFIPVVHFPNTWPGQSNWGISNLALVLQILDDIMATDTDLQATSAIVGSPPVAVSGANMPKDESGNVLTYGPRTVWETGEGTLTMLENSKGLDALIKFKNELRETLAINAKVPESMLGRVKPSDVPSGIALWLSFAPHSGMINQMRLVRHDKYRLLLKFVQRYMAANNQIPEVVENVALKFGSYLPADKMEAVKMVTEALNAKISPMSLETAVQTLMEAGFTIDDAQAEVRRIEQRMYDDALSLVQATGDINAGRRMLGYEDQAVPPTGQGETPIDQEEVEFGL